MAVSLKPPSPQYKHLMRTALSLEMNIFRFWNSTVTICVAAIKIYKRINLYRTLISTTMCFMFENMSLKSAAVHTKSKYIWVSWWFYGGFYNPAYFTLNANNNTTKGDIKCNKIIDFSQDNSIGSLLGFRKRILKPDLHHESDLSVYINNINFIRVECNITTGSYFNGKKGNK